MRSAPPTTTDPNPDTWSARLPIDPGVLSRRLDDEVVLVHLDEGRIFTLSDSAGRFWELCESGLTLGEARNRVSSEFEVTDDNLEAEIRQLLAMLRRERLIREPT